MHSTAWCSALSGDVVIDSEQNKAGDDEMEQKFQSAYDEVVALKRLLQDLLNVEQSEAHNTDAGGSCAPLSLDGLLRSDCDDDSNDDSAGSCDELATDPDSSNAFSFESESKDATQSPAFIPAHVMCFSDEMRSFVPNALADSSPMQKRRAKHSVTKPPATIMVPRAARRLKQPVPVIPRTKANRNVPDRHDDDHDDNSSDHASDNDANKDRPLSPRKHTPRASRSSLKLLRESATFEPNFQARMRQFVAQNRQKKEQIRLAVCEQEDVCIQPTPTINRRSKRIHRDVSHLMAWNHEKENKLSHLRQAELARQNAQLVGKPAIARRSAALFEQREDELAHCRVEDRLQLLGLIYQYQQEERLLTQRSAAGGFHPRVAPHSANLARCAAPLTAHERLYQLAKRRSKRDDASDKQASESDARLPRSDACRRSASCERAAIGAIPTTVQRLWAIGAEYEKKRQQQRELQNQRVARLRDAPKLSKNSRKIALRRGERAAAQQQQQQQQQSSQQHARCSCCCRQSDEAQSPDGKPTCRVDAVHASAIFAKQLQWKRAKDAKDAQLKRFYDELARSECTFRNPLYNDEWDVLPSAAARDTRDANTAFFERTMQWATNKEKRLAREKKHWDEIVMGECTFQPQLSPPRKRSPSSPRAHSVWSPGKGIVLMSADAPPLSLARPSSPYGCSSTASRRFAPSPRRAPPAVLSTFALPSDAYDALDLEALAAASSSERESDCECESASSPHSDGEQ